MAFGALTPIPVSPTNNSSTGNLWAQGTGVPVNGVQTISTGLKLDPSSVDPNYIVIDCIAGGPAVTGCTFVSAAADLSSVTLSIGQTGADPATIRVHMIPSLDR